MFKKVVFRSSTSASLSEKAKQYVEEYIRLCHFRNDHTPISKTISLRAEDKPIYHGIVEVHATKLYFQYYQTEEKGYYVVFSLEDAKQII